MMVPRPRKPRKDRGAPRPHTRGPRPNARGHHNGRPPGDDTARFIAWASADPPLWRGLTIQEAIEASGAGLHYQVARRILRRLGREDRPGEGGRWRNVDWRLQDTDLARIWGQSLNLTAKMRGRHGHPPAWRWQRNYARPRDPAHVAAIEAEEARAVTAGRLPDAPPVD